MLLIQVRQQAFRHERLALWGRLLDLILAQIDALQPGLVIIDSIQTMFLSGMTSAAGSVSQVRECTARLLRLAKMRNIPMFLVGHVTKEGAIAGPRVLEHRQQFAAERPILRAATVPFASRASSRTSPTTSRGNAILAVTA